MEMRPDIPNNSEGRVGVAFGGIDDATIGPNIQVFMKWHIVLTLL